MSLFKRGETWWVCFTAPGGRRIRRSAGTSEKHSAQEFEDRLKVELWRVYHLGEKPRRTWQETAVRWLTEKSHKADIGQDRQKLKWLHPFLGHLYLDEITRDVIAGLTQVKRQEAENGTTNRYLALVRSVLRMARDEWDWVERIPVLRLLPEPRRRVRWLKREEAARVIAELPPHLADLAALSLATGLRQRNASFLTWAQVDMVRGMAWIHADESKSGKAITVPLNEEALRVLRRRQGQDSKYVVTYQGHPVARTSTKAWYKALERAGVEDFRWHDLRHTWASWHVQAGTSLAELQQLGGWSCLEMVLRYAHLGGEHLKAAARRIDDTNLTQRVNFGKLQLVVSH